MYIPSSVAFETCARVGSSTLAAVLTGRIAGCWSGREGRGGGGGGKSGEGEREENEMVTVHVTQTWFVSRHRALLFPLQKISKRCC